MVAIEIIYITSDGSIIHCKLFVPSGSTIADVIKKSNLLDTHPEIQNLSVGVFSKQKSLTNIIQDGDRIEIYRPLMIDPKEKRRQRAITN